MVKTKNIIVALGVVAGLGVTALPMATHAASSQNTTVTVNVASQLELSIDSTAVAINMDVNDLDEASKSTLSVTTNTSGYQIQVKDTATTGTPGSLVNGSNSIPSISTSSPAAPVAGTAGWGLKVGTSYYGVSGTAATIKDTGTSHGAVTNETTDVYYSVATGSHQAVGSYTATLQYSVIAAS